jgi:hypothetical protein
MSTPPFIVNLAPTPNDFNSGLTGFIKLSFRDVETYVVADSVRIAVGYAKIRASGTQLFDEILPRTTRSSVLFGVVDLHNQPATSIISGSTSVTKTTNGNQQSVYITSLDVVSIHSFLATAIITPITISNGQPGGVFGVENGPRNTGVYVFFERAGGVPQIRMRGPANSLGVSSPNTVISFDWSGEKRYIIIWNETRGKVEFYCINSGVTTLINEESISSFQIYDSTPGGTPRRGGLGDITMLYGIEGQIGEQIIIGNVAITSDVGFPIIGLVRTGDFITIRRTDETIRYEGGNPKQNVSSWFGPDDKFFVSPDTSGVVKVLNTGAVRITKLVSGDSMALYREEPSLLGSDTDGFMLEATFFAIPSQLAGPRVTGMGFMIFDGQTIFYLGLLSGTTRTIGLLKKGGSVIVSSSYQIPVVDLDWSSTTSFRLVVDPRRGLIDLYNSNLTTPILSTPFDRAQLPDDADFDLVGLNPFVSFGHISDIQTLGSLDLNRLVYSCSYQSYEAKDGNLPDAADPVWISTASGFSSILPGPPLTGTFLVGGGFGILPLGLFVITASSPLDIAVIENRQLIVSTAAGSTHTYSRSIAIDPNRGAVVEIRLQITRSKPRSRAGYYVMIDDGLTTYALSFVDTEIGKFVCIPVRSSSGLVEIVGTEGIASKLSTLINWNESHIYRLERRPLDGLYLFIDNSITPILVLTDSDKIDYPQSQFLTPTVAFGHISGEGLRSATDFVRVEVSKGYEISTRKIDSTSTLEQDVRNTQAIVVAIARDNDP